jgi:hypothetical protein
MRPIIPDFSPVFQQFDEKQQNFPIHYATIKSDTICCHDCSHGQRVNDISVTVELRSLQVAECAAGRKLPA